MFILSLVTSTFITLFTHFVLSTFLVCMYVYIYSSDMDIYKNYTVIMKIIIYSVEISSPIGTISNSEVVNLQ